MKDGYYDPSNGDNENGNDNNNDNDDNNDNEVDNGNTETAPTKDPSGVTKTPEAGLEAEEQESESELSGGEKAGIAVGSLAGVGSIGTAIGVIAKKFIQAVKKSNDSTDEDTHHNKQDVEQKNTQKNTQTNSQENNQSNSQSVVVNVNLQYPYPNQGPPCEA